MVSAGHGGVHVRLRCWKGQAFPVRNTSMPRGLPERGSRATIYRCMATFSVHQRYYLPMLTSIDSVRAAIHSVRAVIDSIASVKHCRCAAQSGGLIRLACELARGRYATCCLPPSSSSPQCTKCCPSVLQHEQTATCTKGVPGWHASWLPHAPMLALPHNRQPRQV